jgi:hypothetical protein
MRKAIVLFALSIAVCGCNKNGGQSRLEPLARGLTEAWQPVALDMKLDISAEVNGEQVTLRCILRNISANAIDVDQESLPWNNAGAFSVSAVAAGGEVIQQAPVSTPAVLAHISAPHSPVPFASGESMEGRIDMGHIRISDIPHNEDWLLLWSYPLLKDWRSEAHYTLSGVTLLKARSQTPATGFPKTKLETVSGTSVPTQQLKQDLRDAQETLVINDEVIRLKAFPWQNRIRLISEHGTPLPLTLRVQAIWMLQDSKIWNVDTVEETVGESNGSSRDFLVHDGPNWESMTPADVVIKLRDDQGATHFLAVRHQRIAAVE